MAKLARMPATGRAAEADAETPRIPRLRTRFYAFLSYSHKDKTLADWLHRELERYHVPKALAGKLTANGVVPRRLAPIFRDQQDLSAGGDLADEIRAALAASQFLIVLCSPDAAKSRWTNQEVESFKRTRPEGCVIAAVAAGEPFASDIPGREAEECFPPALRYKYDRRGHQTSKRAEPLAADFRDGAEGRRLAFLKLVAGMLGVGLDELVQREQSRRHRRLGWLAAASLAGMALTSGLSVVAVQSRNEAREQRREAEGLVAYMVGDLKDKLEPIGKLDALDGVGSRVLAYYRKQDAYELSDAALLQRSRALSITAQVAYLRGHFEQAQGLYQQALAGTAEAVRRSPDDPKRLFDHAQNVFWLGEIARFRGRTNDAVAAYSEYKHLADRLVAIEPDNLRWRMESLYGVENIGISLYNNRRFAEAAHQFRTALGPMQNLASVVPGNPTYQKELATILAWLADAERSLGKLEAAIDLRQRQVALLNRAAASGGVEFRQELIPAHQGLGILLASHGQTERAVEELSAAVAEADRLIPIEPGNSLWKSYAANAHLHLADTLLGLGRRDEAAAQTTAGCALVERMQAGRSANSKPVCLTLRCRLALDSGATAQAMQFARQALASAQAGRNDDPVKDKYRVAAAHRLLGDVRQRMGDSDGARISWSNAFSVLPQNVPELPTEMDERATILQRLGRSAEAQQISSRLSAMGYRRTI